MAYAQQSDLNLDAQRLIELTDNENSPNVIDQSVVDATEAQSETVINGMLAGALPAGTVPFASTPATPPIITLITAYLWAYRLFRHRDSLNIPPSIVADEAKAWQLLQSIVDGDIRVTPDVANLNGVPEVESSCPRGWTPRDLVGT